jgi:uncharacterized membrane protein
VHWGLSGQPDDYGGRFEGLLGLPLVALVVYLLMLGLPRLDPARANYRQFEGAYRVIRLSTLAVLVGLQLLILLSIRGVGLNMATLAPALVGAFFVVLGGTMGKVRPNWFVGIRTPWTLESKLSWTKTHRLGGWFFMLSGAALIASGLVGEPWAFFAALAATAVGVVGLIYYSYRVWRDDPHREPAINARPAEPERR